MSFLSALWLPILVSAVGVFVASSLLHMVLKYHHNDYRPIPDEDKFLAAIRPANLKPGLYVFPYCLPKDMKSPAAIEKYKQGPVGFMTVIPSGPPAMPKFLIMWFGYCLLISIFVGYITWHTDVFGRPHHAIFHVAAVSAFLAYGVAQLVNVVWKGQRWPAMIKDLFDAFIYALVTAVAFAHLWPH